MDKITQGLLGEFSKEFDVAGLAEDERFELFASYLTVHKHYSETAFDPSDLWTGGGGDTSIDGIAIIVNNNLVTDIDTIAELLDTNGYLDVTFVFVQAERSSNFETQKIGQFGYGVRDFFGPGKLKRNDAIQNAADIMAALFAKSGKFTKGNPACILYYVTTGKWQNDHNLVTRYTSEVEDLKATGNFRNVEFYPVGADQIQKLHSQAKNAISREFMFQQRTVIPDIANVKEAHLGFLSGKEFLRLICDDDGNLIESLFYENVRGWEGYNTINTEIRETLKSDARDRFVLMNNGITIIARSLHTTGHKFTMGDFQIVNGCQTSNVLYDNRELLDDDAIRIPVRIVCTTDEAVMESVITATNRQTAIKLDQFFALKDFAKKIENYFRSFEPEKRLYYERRAHQYDSQEIPKNRIIPHETLVRSVGAMFLAEPHRTTRTYRLLREKVGTAMFSEADRLEPYYVAAFSLFTLDQQFKTKKMPPKYKPARYHLLLAARLLMDGKPLPPMSSGDMGKRCDMMTKMLWTDSDKLFSRAQTIIDTVAKNNYDRDHIRTEPITNAILQKFGQKVFAS